MNNLEIITKVLKKDKRLWSDDKKPQLLKAELISLIAQDDEKLIELLISEKKIEGQFFKKAGKAIIFKKEKFLQLVTMNEFLPDSFTAFENKIGLEVNGKLLSKNDDVSLVFPHKDCVLEGGQTKKESKRDEIFFNTVLAPDEVDRLKEPKVFTNAVRINKDGEQKVSEVSEKDNLIIKGNNLLALYSLIPEYREKIKLIYIDPPYYFEETKPEDTFTYNSNFKLSTWLVFMRNRLEAAKELLTNGGYLFIQINEDGHAALRMLAESIEGLSFISDIAVKAKSSAGASGGGEDKKLKKNYESILVFGKGDYSSFNKVFSSTPLEQILFEKKQDGKRYEYDKVLINLGKKNHVAEISASGQTTKVYRHHDYEIESVSSLAKKEQCSEYEIYCKYYEQVFRTQDAQSSIRHKVVEVTNADKELYSISYIPKSGKNKDKLTTFYYFKNEMINHLTNTTKMIDGDIVKRSIIGTLWSDIGWDGIASEGGVKLKGGKKPERLIERVIKMSTKKNDIVLDYHLGSGTTAAVAHKMNRRYIGIEQLDSQMELAKKRLNNVIQGDKTGISKDVEWKGGGDFVYFEMLEWNQKYIDLIEKATEKDILSIKKKIEKEAFYKYQINFDDLDEKEFSKLSLKDQKKVLCDVLDLNHLYVNLGSINDSTFKVSKEDKEFNEKFYNNKK